MSSAFQIRQFRFPEDYQQVINLWSSMEKGVRVGRSDTPAEIEKKLARDPDLFLVAECGEEIVGSIIGGYDGRRGMIYHLAVSASFQGRGIGSQLMEEIEERLRRKGCLKSYLLIAEDNHDVEPFYRKHGWEHMDTVHLFGKNLL
ncbi:MAG: GNAT family acetyltransferase [Syntrophothermus sp.]